MLLFLYIFYMQKNKMKKNNIIIGSHVNFCAPKYLLGCIEQAKQYNANAFMFYTGAPQNSKRIDFNKLNINEYLKQLSIEQINPENVIIHAPYIINLCVEDKVRKQYAIDYLLNEVKRIDLIHSKYLVVHPGSAINVSKEQAIKNVAEVINSINKHNKNVVICIETMAGKGNEVGYEFEQISQIISYVDNKNLVGVCLDTCHINDAGYNVHDVNEIVNKFDKIIGLKYLKVIHLNDSKNPNGAKKDRHENIGYGKIGFKTLLKFVHHEKLINVTKILETPWYNNKPMYKEEINCLLSKKWVDYR